PPGGTRERDSHLAAAVIGDEPYRIDRLARRARRDDYFLSPQCRLSFEQPSDVTHDYIGLRHPTGSTDLAHGQRTFVGLEDLITKRSRVGHVTLRLCMGPHAVVHRGNE